MNGILTYATDFLSYCGNIVVGWQLLEHACIAKSKMGETSGDERTYLESKRVDFKIFCQFQLVKNIGIGNSILNFEEDLTSLVV